MTKYMVCLTDDQREVVEGTLLSSSWWGNPDTRRVSLDKLGINTTVLPDYSTAATMAMSVVQQVEQKGCPSLIQFIENYLRFAHATPQDFAPLRSVLKSLAATTKVSIDSDVSDAIAIPSGSEHGFFLSDSSDGSEYSSCFISYNHKDNEFATRLYNDLQAYGVKCWKYTEDVRIGNIIRVIVSQAIEHYDKLLVIFSEQSVNSNWVADEVEEALALEEQNNRQMLFPIAIDDAVRDARFTWTSAVRRHRHIGDFTQWRDPDRYNSAFQRILRDLKRDL